MPPAPAPPSTHRLSNSLTVEKNVLGGGSIGHILRNRKINPETYAATDVWYHYDQVGSVMFRSNASGNSMGYRLADAFGNQLASATTGTALWASDAASAGWGHNTKEHDASTGLVYMYQRWYTPETGTFLSTAPYPPMVEHPYGFAEGNPVGNLDPDGRDVIAKPPPKPPKLPGYIPHAHPNPNPGNPCEQNCIRQGCVAARSDGVSQEPLKDYCLAYTQCADGDNASPKGLWGLIRVAWNKARVRSRTDSANMPAVTQCMGALHALGYNDNNISGRCAMTGW